MTQRDRLLRALEHGPVPATAFAAPDVIDGGKPVFRVAARIGELRDAGYEILTTRAPSGVAVYHLARNVESPGRPTDAPPPSVGGQLFATPEANAPRPHYVEEAEAA